MSPEELNALVDKMFESRKCWVSGLPDDAKRFLELVLAESEKKGQPPNGRRATEILNKHFHVEIGDNAVRKHLLGRCACAR